MFNPRNTVSTSFYSYKTSYIAYKTISCDDIYLVLVSETDQNTDFPKHRPLA